MNLNLKKKQVFITGGSRGIGLAVAKAFAREGADIAIGARNQEQVEAEADNIQKNYKVKAIGIAMDVTNPDDIENARKITEKTFGGVDILINNAGTGTKETIMEAPDKKWYQIWDLHVMAAVRTARAFIPYMRKRGGGAIINTSSVCATQPLWYEPIYNTTKAALSMMTKCLANEVIKDNIRVNIISPGLILTPDWWKTAKLLAEKEGITPKEYLDRIAMENAPIGRFASPEELAETYIFLASEKSSYSVGSTYYVDGGWITVVK